MSLHYKTKYLMFTVLKNKSEYGIWSFLYILLLHQDTDPCENKMQLCVKAAEKPAFLQLFCVFLRKLQKSCGFF